MQSSKKKRNNCVSQKVSFDTSKVITTHVSERIVASWGSLHLLLRNKVGECEKQMLIKEYFGIVRKALVDASQ